MPSLDQLVNVHGVPVDLIVEKNIRPWEQGLQELKLTGGALEFDFNPESKEMKLKVPGELKDYRVDAAGYEEAMRLSGFAESVIKAYPPDLMMKPLNYGFNRKIGDNVKALVMKDNLVAFTKPNLELVSTEDLMRSVSRVLGDEILVERFYHDLGYTNCSIIVPEVSREWEDDRLVKDDIKVNDVICGGISFQGSITGKKPLIVSAFVYRLVCGNGMVSADVKYKWSRKTETVPVTQWFEDRLVACKEGLQHEFDKVQSMIDVKIPEGSRADVLSNVFREYEISDRMRGAVLQRMTDYPPRNMWDVLNGITELANDQELGPHTARRLQEIGGEMATKLHVCEVCHSVTRN